MYERGVSHILSVSILLTPARLSANLTPRSYRLHDIPRSGLVSDPSTWS